MLLSHARVSGHVTPRNPLKIDKNDHFWPKIAILGIFAFWTQLRPGPLLVLKMHQRNLFYGEQIVLVPKLANLAKNGKNVKNGHFQLKKYHFWPFWGWELLWVLWPVIQAYQRSTHFSHNIEKAALYVKNSENGGQKGFAIPCVNVPFHFG